MMALISVILFSFISHASVCNDELAKTLKKYYKSVPHQQSRAIPAKLYQYLYSKIPVGSKLPRGRFIIDTFSQGKVLAQFGSNFSMKLIRGNTSRKMQRLSLPEFQSRTLKTLMLLTQMYLSQSILRARSPKNRRRAHNIMQIRSRLAGDALRALVLTCSGGYILASQ